MDDLGNQNDTTADDYAVEHSSSQALSVMDPELEGIGAIAKRRDSSRRSETIPVSNETPEQSKQTRDLRPPFGMVAGVVFGLASAVLYTLANIALRRCVGIDPLLVSAVKAGPTVIVLGPFLAWMLLRGEVIATSYRMVPRFMGAALVGQFVGNAAFQVALGMIGLAVAVPITLGTMIVGAAALGRLVLHEPVRLRTGVAMLVLIASVVVLSLPGNVDAVQSESAVSGASQDASQIWIGSMFAASSGAAYALFGVVMRKALTGGLSAPLTMFISGSVGTIALWSVTLLRIGLEPLSVLQGNDWAIMFAAGVLNFTAFVALAVALKSLPVVAVNLINASQVAMAAVAGILLFAEPVTATLISGIALTFLGLGILAGRRKRTAVQIAPGN